MSASVNYFASANRTTDTQNGHTHTHTHTHPHTQLHTHAHKPKTQTHTRARAGTHSDRYSKSVLMRPRINNDFPYYTANVGVGFPRKLNPHKQNSQHSRLSP